MGEASVTVPTNETLLVVDGHSLAFRAFFALPVDNFSTSSGQATNAVWGFATMLAQVIDAEKPDHLGVAFDVKGGTFRNEMLPQYKGTREAAPEELLTQLGRHQVEIVWVKGHAGHPENERCDRLAVAQSEKHR